MSDRGYEFSADRTVIYRDCDHSYWHIMREPYESEMYLLKTEEPLPFGERLVSVTQLLSRHGISKDLSKVSRKLLDKKAKRGTFVHEEIERFIKFGEYGVSDEFNDFLDLVYPMADRWDCEVIIHTDVYAGRVDLIGYRDNETIIVDTKTGTVDEYSTAWQTSLYGYALTPWFKSYVFDAKPDGKSRLTSLDVIPLPTCTELTDAEKNGEIWNPQIDISDDTQIQIADIDKRIAEMEQTVKGLKENRDRFFKMMLEKMQEKGIYNVNTPHLAITRVRDYDRTTIDSTSLKKNLPEVYATYAKTTHVGESIKVMVKDEQSK